MQCLTVSFHDMFLLVMMRSLSKKFMMKPYPQQNLTADKRVYNYRHSRARRISENLFGILANRWRIFFTTINLEPKHVENIVLSALALHNMLIKNPAYRPGNLADTLLEDGEVLEGEWLDNVVTDSFYPLQKLFHEQRSRGLTMEMLLETLLIIHGLVIQL